MPGESRGPGASFELDSGSCRSVGSAWSAPGRPAPAASAGVLCSSAGAPPAAVWRHAADPSASVCFFFLQIYHGICFAGALCTLLAAFLSALISCVVAYYSEWESLGTGAEGGSTAFDRLKLVVLSSIALLIEVVFLSEVATTVCTCAFRLSWDMIFQGESFLEMRVALTDYILQADDHCAWGRAMDLLLQGFIYAALDLLPFLYAAASLASAEPTLSDFMVRMFDASIFGAATVSGLWFFLMVAAKYCEWLRFWCRGDRPAPTDDEGSLEEELRAGEEEGRRSAGSSHAVRVELLRRPMADSERGVGGCNSGRETPATRSCAGSHCGPGPVPARPRRAHRPAGRSAEEVARRNLCLRLCALVDAYWRLPRRVCLARCRPWLGLPAGALLVFEAQALWAAPYLLETLVATCLLLGVLSTYLAENPKWLKVELLHESDDCYRIRPAPLPWCPCSAFLRRFRTFVETQHARLRVEFARRIALLALCHFFFCLRGTLNLSWHHVLMSRSFASVCVARMLAYYVESVHGHLWLMELASCALSSVVAVVWSVCKAVYFDMSAWDSVRLPLLLVLCHLGMPGWRFVRRGRAFNRAEGLLIAGSFSITVVMLMTLCFGLTFSDMKLRTQNDGRITCSGSGRPCAWVEPKSLPEPYPFCGFKAWDTNMSLVDFGLLSTMAYSDLASVRADLEVLFPGWRLVCYNLHMQEDNLRDDRCLGRPPSESVKRADWTSFMEFVPPGGGFSVIAVRGTQVPIEVLIDINIWLTTLLIQGLEFFGPRIVYSEKQYWTFKAIEIARKVYPYDQLLNQFKLLSELLERRKGGRVYMTGHSLGGGIALLAGLHRSQDPAPPRAVTFCSPSTFYTAKLLGLTDVAPAGADLPNDELQMMRAVQVKPAHDPVSSTDAPVGAVMPLLCRAQAKTKCHSITQAMCELIATCGDAGRDVRFRVKADKCSESYRIAKG